MSYSIHLEPVVDLLRIFKLPLEYGDEFEFVATVVYSDGGKTAEIKGVKSKNFPLISVREILWAEFAKKGVETVKFQRYKNKQSYYICTNIETGKTYKAYEWI